MTLGRQSSNAGLQLVRRKSAEHHRMDRADPGHRQHGEHGLRDHRHVDQHPIALADTLVAENGSHRLDLEGMSRSMLKS